MKNLLRLMFLTVIIFSINGHIPDSNIISCAPGTYYFRATITSVRSGLWSDPRTWGGAVPGAADNVTIQAGHTVLFDKDATISGMNVAGTWQADPSKSTILQSTGNIIVTGQLIRQIASPVITSVIRFTGINENNFVGGGMDVLASDVGLWVMGAGQLVEQGAKKTSWTRAAGSVPAGATTIQVKEATGWLAGDEITIVPTAEGDYAGFEDFTIQAVNGTTVVLNKPCARAHPMVNNQWTAEVMNLTRNIRTEGTAGGRSHVFIRSTKPQTIEYVQYRYLGPRKQQKGDAAKEAVLGRYGLHIHHSMDGSRGTVVRGCVMRDIGNNVYVPHVSHGIHMQDNIAYNILGSGFWWDEGYPESSHGVCADHMIVAKCDYVRGSINMFDDNNPKAPVLSARGYMLNFGDDDTLINSVAVGVYGDPHDGGGVKWEAVNNDHSEGVWVFDHFLSHNIDAAGALTWQNVQYNHFISNYTAYYCKEGWFQGAYSNPYGQDSTTLYAAPLVVHAGGPEELPQRMFFQNSTFVDVELQTSPVPSKFPILFRNCTIRNFKDIVTSPQHNADLVQCNISGSVTSGSDIVRVQPSTGQAYKVQNNSKTNLSTFAPAVWGNGKGLKGTYYGSPNFTNPLFTRTDNIIAFTEWANGVHHLINNNSFSVIENGYFQAQFNDKYTITAAGPGTITMFINNIQYNGTASLNLEAGKWYSIQIKYSKNNTQRGGLTLFWRSPQLDKFSPGGEYIPMCQLSDKPQIALALPPPLATLPLPTRIKVITLMGNPVTDKIRIGVPAGTWQYILTDMQGRTLGVGKLIGNRVNEIGVSVLAAGTYVLKAVSDKSDPVSKKIIKL